MSRPATSSTDHDALLDEGRSKAQRLAPDTLVEAFQRDGAACLRGVLTPAEVAALARGIDANLTATRRRRVFSLRYLGDDITHAPRRWKTSPEFPGLAAELAAGAPMRHALFPLLVGKETGA